MRFPILLFCLSIAASALAATGKSTITIGSHSFTLASSAGNENEKLREYLLNGENFDRWTRLVAVREFSKISDPEAYIKNMAALYQKKRPYMQFRVFKNDKAPEWVIDFLDYPDSSTERFVEWNVFRAKKQKEGIVVYQYAQREYARDESDEPFSRIGEIRKSQLKEVYSAGFEERVTGKDG